MKLVLSETASQDLSRIYQAIYDFVGSLSAEKVIDEIFASIQLALEQPLMGIEGTVPNTRELFPRGGKYRIVYQVRDEQFIVLTILLSKQKYP